MSGSIFGLGLSQQINSNGKPMAGCKLYLYEANTTTPAVAYSDFGLTAGLELTFPIEADANGRLPALWVADGSYRARLTDSSGVVQFDLPEVLAIGASSGSGSGGGVSATAIHQTGDFIWRPTSGTRSGWVRANGRTIGSATSGGTERANDDTEALFLEFWNSYSDTLCPVTGGRGANAAADWAANKLIATLNMQGVAAIGLAAMGGTDNATLDNVTFAVGNKTTAASLAGAATVTLDATMIPSHTHTATSVVTDPGHHHDLTGSGVPTGSGNTRAAATYSSTNSGTPGTSTSTTGVTVATTNASTGGGLAHSNMQPSRTGSWYVKI